jgi:hypothetical protein
MTMMCVSEAGKSAEDGPGFKPLAQSFTNCLYFVDRVQAICGPGFIPYDNAGIFNRMGPG